MDTPRTLPKISETVITAEDVEAWERENPSREIINGQWAKDVKMAGFQHGVLATRLIVKLDAFVSQNKLGQVLPDAVNYVLKGTPKKIEVMRIPDVSFVREEKADRGLKTYCYFAPDLAIEIISPTEDWADTQAKIADYLQYGSGRSGFLTPKPRKRWFICLMGQSKLTALRILYQGAMCCPALRCSWLRFTCRDQYFEFQCVLGSGIGSPSSKEAAS